MHLIKAIASSVDVDEYKETLTECIKTLAKQNNIRFKPENFDSMVDRVMDGRMN